MDCFGIMLHACVHWLSYTIPGSFLTLLEFHSSHTVLLSLCLFWSKPLSHVSTSVTRPGKQ